MLPSTLLLLKKDALSLQDLKNTSAGAMALIFVPVAQPINNVQERCE